MNNPPPCVQCDVSIPNNEKLIDAFRPLITNNDSAAMKTLAHYEAMLDLPPEVDIANVQLHNFNTVRNGDMIAMCNIVELIRRKNPNIKFHITDGAIHQTDYCIKFRKFLCDNTNYLSPTPGRFNLMHNLLSPWDTRGAIGDMVSINIPRVRQKKICVFPIFDAPYNQWRNWPLSLTQEIIDNFSTPEFADYEKVFCSLHKPDLNYRDFTFSIDFHENLEHLMTSEYYVGGDTGMSHFAGALKNGPTPIYYLHGECSRLHTLPFHYATKGKIIMYGPLYR